MQFKRICPAGLAILLFLAASCDKPISLVDARSQLARFRDSSPYLFLCAPNEREVFRGAVSDYARSRDAEKLDWISPNETDQFHEWVLRDATAGLFTGLIKPDDFGPFKQEMKKLQTSAAEQRDLFRPASSRLRSITALTHEELGKAAKEACTELVSYGITLSDSQIKQAKLERRRGHLKAPPGFRMLFIDEQDWTEVAVKEDSVRKALAK